MADWLYWIDGEADDMAPEDRAAIARETEQEAIDDEIATEREDADRAERDS